MRNTRIVYVVAFIAAICCVGLPADAQTACKIWGTGFVKPYPPGTFDCDQSNNLPGEGYSTGCWVRNKCAPPDAALKTRCPFCHTAQGGNPIDLATGDTFIDETDIRIPGIGGSFTLGRTWNSLWPASVALYQVGLFGPNWRSTYEEKVFDDGNGWFEYARGDGSFWAFYWNGTAWSLIAPANASATLVQGTSYWTVSFQNGEQRLFDPNSGNLTSIIDRNGNTTQIAYDSIGRMTSVTDPASRHLYFNYANDTSYLVTSVTTDFAMSLAYGYDSQGRLTQVTKPDQTTLNFQYDSNSMISSVKDTNGKILETHTYDSLGRGLTSSRAGGVDAITVTYPQQ